MHIITQPQDVVLVVSAQALCPSGEIGEVGLKAITGGGVGEFFVFVEFLGCAAEQEARVGEGISEDCGEDVAKVILGACCSERTGACADDPDRFVSEGGFVGGAGSPIDGIFEDAGDAVIVFGCGDQKAVGLCDRFFEGDHGFG